MADRVDEDLLGYLLEALEPSEREAIEKRLEQDVELQRRLIRMREKLRPLWDVETEVEPPLGLAERTCRLVAEQAGRDEEELVHAPPEWRPRPKSRAKLLPPSPVPTAPASSSWRWADLAVTSAILAASLLLVLPAIESSRSNARIAACQDNLRELGQALIRYSDFNGGYFPVVPAEGNLAAAGMYAPTLLDGGFLDDARRLVCPNSVLASQGPLHVPSLKELLAVSDQAALQRLRATMGGSYGYSLGYIENGHYRGTRNLARAVYALMADAPSGLLPDLQSLNHDGRGENVLFEDGRVLFLTRPRPIGSADHFYLNDGGQVAAGRHRDDAVIGPSDAAPLRFVNLK